MTLGSEHVQKVDMVESCVHFTTVYTETFMYWLGFKKYRQLGVFLGLFFNIKTWFCEIS